jgi:hypothetical protein
MKSRVKKFRSNLKLARALWGDIPDTARGNLRELTGKFALSVADGHIQLLDGRCYITHSGLLRIAENRHCLGITTAVQESLSDPLSDRWVFKATVYKDQSSKAFTGYGDATRTNVTAIVRGAEMRVAETRAVNRALRKAYGIAVCSVEELGSPFSALERASEKIDRTEQPNRNGSANGQPRLRDKLCLLIRRYELDSNLIKRYAADFCGTETLRDASRDLVEAFVSTVAKEAANDRAALICKLNSYCQPEEVRS